jgi:hypothetical protein
MRTTLTLDPDVAEFVRREMRRTGEGMKKVVNEALRAVAAGEGKPVKLEPFVVEAAPMGLRPGYDYDRMNQLYDELEAEDQLRKMRR